MPKAARCQAAKDGSDFDQSAVGGSQRGRRRSSECLQGELALVGGKTGGRRRFSEN